MLTIGLLATLPLLATASQTAAPHPAAAASDAQPEVIVLGERTPRALRGTASSVVVVTAADLESWSAAESVDALLAAVPNLQVGSGGEGIAIRGQDSTGVLRDLSAFLGGTRPRATLQLDGRPLSYFEYVFGTTSVWDAARVEVFRSPQTTTQGRNSIAGAIFVETEVPLHQWQARGRLLAGDWDARQASLSVTGPIVDEQLAFRASADLRRKRYSSTMADGIPEAGLDHESAGVARLKLLAEPAALPDLRIEATYVHGRSEAAQFEAVQAPFEARRFSQPERTNGVYRIAADSLTARAQWAVSEDLVWRTTISHGDVLSRRFGLPGLGFTRVSLRDSSLESLLDWQAGSALSLLAGVHRLQTRQRQSIDVTGLGLGRGEFRDRQDSLGIFGEARWRVAPDWMVTFGLRYQQDRQDREGALLRPIATLPLAYDRSFDASLPKLSIAYDWSDRTTVGLLAQRAFNPGGTTISLVTCAPDDFEAETLWNFEAFLRYASSDGRARLSANVFRSELRDAQRPQLANVVPCGLSASRSLIGNAPSARTEGAELQLDWRATDRLDVRVGVGILDTRTLRTELPGDPARGREFQRAPAVSGSAQLVFRPAAAWRISGSVAAHGHYFSDDANTAALRVGGSAVVGLDVARTFGRVTVSAYAHNLFDRFALTYLFSPVFGTARDPREVGLSVEARL